MSTLTTGMGMLFVQPMAWETLTSTVACPDFHTSNEPIEVAQDRADRAEAIRLMPPYEVLRRLAARSHPPQAWYDE